VIDYKNERFEEKAGQPDVVIDLVGGDTLARSYSVVTKGGTLVTTVQPTDEQAAKKAGIHAVMMLMHRKSTDLAELARLVGEGAVKPRLGHTMSLTEAKQAQEMSEKGKTRGKVILEVA
jgi:NADPH:quinone reductase-like Zn-dependent oxidoreductase